MDSQAAIDGSQFGLTVVRDGMYDILAEHPQFLRQKIGYSYNAAHGHAPCPSGTVDKTGTGTGKPAQFPAYCGLYDEKERTSPGETRNTYLTYLHIFIADFEPVLSY
jgi:hypothetical protein